MNSAPGGPRGTGPERVHVLRDLAPTGELRVAINLGNSAVVQRNESSGEMSGVAVDLSRALVTETGLDLKFIACRSAKEVVNAEMQDAWDMAFLAIDAARGKRLAFTMPYLQLEGRMMVRHDSPAHMPDALDVPGVRIAVTAGSAYDLFLGRTLTRARLERFATSAKSFDAVLDGRVDAAAGLALSVQSFISRNPGLRVLDPAFMIIDQGIAIPIARKSAVQYVSEFLARQIAEGRVAGSLSENSRCR